MHTASVVTTVLAILQFFFLHTDERLHMPNVPEVKLPADVIKAMQLPPMTSKYCLENANQRMTEFGKLVSYIARNFRKKVALEITPCKKCYLLDTKITSIAVDNLKIYYTPGIREVKEADLTVHPAMKIRCTSCQLMDDENQLQDGEIDFFWCEPRIHVVCAARPNPLDNPEYLLANGTIDNTTIFETECKGSKEFRRVCLEVHKSKELEHVMQHAAQQLFKTDTNIEARELYFIRPANPKEDKEMTTYTGSLDEAFLCFDEDLVPFTKPK